MCYNTHDMAVEPQKTLEKIRAEFMAAEAKLPKTETPPLSEAGKRFLAQVLRGNPQVPGKAVREGKIQDGEFD